MSSLTKQEKEYYARKAREELALLNEDLRSIELRSNESFQAILRQIAAKIGCLVEDLLEILQPILRTR